MKVEKSKCKPLDFIYIDINTINIFLLCLYIIEKYTLYTQIIIIHFILCFFIY